jgi:hypothetical protein
VEGFNFGAIFQLVGMLISFFKNIGVIVEAIVFLFVQFPVDPFGTLINLVTILLGMIVGTCLLVVYTILDVLFIPYLLALAFAYVKDLSLGILITVLLVLYTLALAVPYAVLWILIDFPFNGLATKMLRCENAPDAWYTRAGFAYGNEFDRFFPLCFCPCGSRYRLTDNGLLCQRLPAQLPSYCPQQEVMRILQSKSAPSDRPFAFVGFKPSAWFWRLPSVDKRDAMLRAYRDKVSMYQSCYERTGGYDYITRHACSNVAWMDDLDDAAKKALATVCVECFCDYRRDEGDEQHAWRTAAGYQRDGGGGDNSAACARLRQIVDPSTPQARPPPPGPELLRKTLLLCIVAFCALLVLLTVMKDA